MTAGNVAYSEHMQDRYAGDVGDFGKFALLRALCGGRSLGVCWYRTDAAEEKNNDGRHLDYLRKSDRFEYLDPEVFNGLKRFVESFRVDPRRRSVAHLEKLGLLPDRARFHKALCPTGAANSDQRRAWATGMTEAMDGAQLIFLDPDNGLETASPNHKSVLFSELKSLRSPSRALLFYQHQTRRKGGARSEFNHTRSRLERHTDNRDVVAVRLRPYSSRFYFLLDADKALRDRLKAFADHWSSECEAFLSHRP